MVLTRTVSFVGFPYVWGGTSERTQTLFGVTRVAASTAPASGGSTGSSPIRARPSSERCGRTASRDAGEVPVSARIRRRSSLRPGDLFFSERGTEARPGDVSHMGIYAGGGWFVHSSSQGTTMTTLSGWYADRFAWGRRPLREAGLT